MDLSNQKIKELNDNLKNINKGLKRAPLSKDYLTGVKDEKIGILNKYIEQRDDLMKEAAQYQGKLSTDNIDVNTSQRDYFTPLDKEDAIDKNNEQEYESRQDGSYYKWAGDDSFDKEQADLENKWKEKQKELQQEKLDKENLEKEQQKQDQQERRKKRNIVHASKDPFKTLEISQDADMSEITKQYRKLSLKYHPDKNPGDTFAEEKFKEIGSAYEQIKDAKGI